MIGRRVHVRSTKYDGSPHWEFDSWLTLEKGPLLVTINFIGEVMQTWRGPWTNPYHTRNHFWSDRWYNVLRLERSEGGEFEGWYCNVTTPAEFDGEHLAYADLDLDVRVSVEGEVEILDEDEFQENSGRMAYPPDVVERARAALDELVSLAEAGQFPFERPGAEVRRGRG